MGILRVDRVAGLGGANAINGSAHFHGDHDGTAYVRYIDAGISDDFNFGTGDFTVECWINRSSLSNDDAIWATTAAEGSSSLFWYFNSSGNLRAYLGEGTSERTSSSNNIIRDRWYHVALTRASGTVNMWVDGVSKYSASNVTANVGSSTQNFIIGDGNTGYNGNAYMFLGHISNLRIQKGKAEYTATFTPPTTRLAVTPETVLLACHDPGNVLAEATGKTLTLIKSGTSGSNSAGIVASRFTPNSPVGFSTTTDVGTQFGSTFDGVTTFDSQAYMVVPGGNTRERNRGRALLGGGHNPSGATNHIFQLSIQSQGNTEDFGDLTYVRWIPAPSSSSTRGVWSGGGGYNPGSPTGSYVNFIDFVTIANSSNATDFGDQTAEKGYHTGLSNETRGIIAGGYNDSVGKIDVIEFITIATAGNAQDFGDLTAARMQFAAAGSPTRGLFFGGVINPNVNGNVVDFITIATTGNAQDFGDMTAPTRYGNATSSNTRAIYGGGLAPDGSTYTNKIEFFTIASAGNGTDFGDLTTTRSTTPGATSNNIRGIFAGGYVPGNVNSIDFVTIATIGNASDFGDLTYDLMRGIGALSDSHGGLE